MLCKNSYKRRNITEREKQFAEQGLMNTYFIQRGVKNFEPAIVATIKLYLRRTLLQLYHYAAMSDDTHQ